MELRGVMKVQQQTGSKDVAESFARLVRNEVSADVGIIGSLTQEDA
jgi:hypothetical protein